MAEATITRQEPGTTRRRAGLWTLVRVACWRIRHHAQLRKVTRRELSFTRPDGSRGSILVSRVPAGLLPPFHGEEIQDDAEIWAEYSDADLAADLAAQSWN